MTLRAQGELPPLDADAWLVWPRGGNTGDELILASCTRYLRDRGINVWTSDGSIETAIVDEDSDYLDRAIAAFRGIFIFPGGGNIGIYHDNEIARAAVILRLRDDQRCLVLPQSAVAAEPALRRPMVRVWCRDAQSKAILDAAGIGTDLVPDASFYLQPDFPQVPSGTGVYFVRRQPQQETESIEHGIGAALLGSDLTFRTPLDEVVATLRPVDTVISDRLHGGLIAMMMGKKTIFLPVGYHKIASFYETWLRDLPSIRYCTTASELVTALAEVESTRFDFRSLFTSHADPALHRFLSSM